MFRCSTSRILVFVALFASLFAGQTSTLRAAPQQQGGAPDLIISKTTYAPYTLVHGQQTTYMLNWLNFSTASATQVVITDTLPAGMDYASANPLPTSRNGNVITWSVGTLAPFSNNVIYLTVDVTAAAGTVLTNTAGIFGAESDANPSSNFASYYGTVIDPSVDVSISKYLYSNNSLTPGSVITYSLNVGYYSASNTPAENVVVTDTLPAGVEFITTTNPVSFTQNGNQLIWNLGTLLYYSSFLNVSVRILPGTPAGTILTNTAVIATTSLDYYPLNNTSQHVGTVVDPTRDLQVAKYIVSTTPVFPGSLITYSLSLQNNGNTAATGVVMTDVLPFGAASFVGAIGSLSPTLLGNQLVWNVGTFAPGYPMFGSNYYVTLRIPSDAAYGTVFTNTATATLNEPDTAPYNNTAIVASTVVSPYVGLFINKTTDMISAGRGQWVTYTLQYGFSYEIFGMYPIGNTDATNVVITDTMPAGMSYVHSGSPVAPSIVGNKIVWALGTIPFPGYGNISSNFKVILRVNDDAFGGLAINTATISSNEREFDPSNNNSAVAFNINAPALTRGVTVTVPANYTASAGDNLIVSFVVSNTGVTTDTFNLNFAQTKGWANFSGLPVAVTLVAGAATTLQVPVKVPFGVVIGDVNQIGLTAQSAGDGNKTAIGSTQVTINRGKVFLPITVRE